MDHPHLARLLDVYESEQHLDLVMEHLEGGELFDRVKNKKRFSERDTAEVTWQMLLALNYMHELEIVHGDIKLENWMYSQKDKNHLKLIDFGFSKMRGQVSEKACGTIAYIAPEVLELHFGPEGDMWSLGVIVFVLLSGNMPFTGTEQQKLQSISRGEYTMKRERWASISADAIDFVRKLLKVEPSRRMRAEDALKHTFIANKHFERRLEVDSSVVDALCQFSHQEKFRRCCLFMMAWSLSEEERAQVEDAFLAIDTHHSGRITYDELYAIMVDKFKLPVAEVKTAFKALSVHGDREIHYSDFLAAMVSSKLAISQDLLQECFQKFDTDGSGYITDAHLKEVLGEKFNGTPTDSMLRDVGTLRPGQMSWHEFACYMQGKPLHLHGDEMLPDLDEVERLNAFSPPGVGLVRSTQSIASKKNCCKPSPGFASRRSYTADTTESTQSSCVLM
jgi:calcium-dependent protein kinase